MCGGLNGSLEALQAAAELIAAGDAERMVVVAADDDGPAAQAWLQLLCLEREHAPGAVAVLLAVAGDDEPAIDLDAAIPNDGPVGHLALLAWLAP